MSTATTFGIIVFDDVLTSEVIGPAEVFSLASQCDWFKETQVILIGVDQKSTIRTAEGLHLQVDTTISNDLTVDVLWVPGSNDISELMQYTELNTYIQRHKDAQWLSSVCAGAFLLGNAGVLDGQQATTWYGGEADLQAQFLAIQVVQDRPVVLDTQRMTANCGLVSYQAAIVLLGRMTSAECAKEIYDSLSMGRLDHWDEIESIITNG